MRTTDRQLCQPLILERCLVIAEVRVSRIDHIFVVRVSHLDHIFEVSVSH